MSPPIARTVMAQARDAVGPVLPTPTASLRLDGDTNVNSRLTRVINANASARNWVCSFWRYPFGFRNRYWCGGVATANGSRQVSFGWINTSLDFLSEFDAGDSTIGQLRWETGVSPTEWHHYYLRFTDGVPNGCLYDGQPWPINPSFDWGPGTDSPFSEVGLTYEVGSNDTSGTNYYRFSGLYYDWYHLYGSQADVSLFAEDDGGTWKAKKYNGSYPTDSFNLDFMDDANLGKDVSLNARDFIVGTGAVTQSAAVPPRIDE